MRQNKLSSNEQTSTEGPSLNFKYYILFKCLILLFCFILLLFWNHNDIGLFVRMSSDYVIPIFSDYVIGTYF